jgi:hypothetical protein
MCAIITYDYPANTLNVLVYEIYLKMYKIEHKTYIQLIKNLYTSNVLFFKYIKAVYKIYHETPTLISLKNVQFNFFFCTRIQHLHLECSWCKGKTNSTFTVVKL